MIPIPKISGCILDDSLFILYGGQTGTSTPQTRAIAYGLAEGIVEQYLNTYLCPETVVTGSFYFPQWVGDSRISLDVTYLQRINQVIHMSLQGCDCSLLSRSGCAHIIERFTGIIDVRDCAQYCWNCCGNYLGTYLVQVVYAAGLDAYMTHDLMLLTALVTLANNELARLTNSAAGCVTFAEDSNITSWSSLDYSESRTLPNVTNIFGSSPMAQYLARMLKKFKRRSALKLH